MNTDEKRVDDLLEWLKTLQVFEDYLAKTGGPFFGGEFTKTYNIILEINSIVGL